MFLNSYLRREENLRIPKLTIQFCFDSQDEILSFLGKAASARLELEEEKSEKKSGAQKSRQPKQFDDDYGEDYADSYDDSGMCNN